jgi:lauroyl/myristoyl acyltransferase
MDTLLYLLVRFGIAIVQSMPVPIVVRIGRLGGLIAYWLDARHRNVAIRNLTMCFGKEKSETEIRALARENFCRLGENYLGAVKSAGMSPEAISPYFKVTGWEKISPYVPNAGPQSRIVAIGHFGNFELFTRLVQFVRGFQGAATYRALRQPSLNRLMQSLREQSGCKFFERRTESAALRAAMNSSGLLLGLLADQHAGRSGMRLPFLGHDCSTSSAPAIFALRYDCPLHVGFCYRTALGRWEIELSGEIPTRENGQARSKEDIMRDVNRAFEVAVRRDPANWFWVHDRWKPVKKKVAEAEPTSLDEDLVEDGG